MTKEEIKQALIGKVIADVIFDNVPKWGLEEDKVTALGVLVFTDGGRLELDTCMAGANDSEPYVVPTLRLPLEPQ